MTYDLILKNGSVALPEGMTQIDIAVKDQRIEAFGTFDNDDAKEIIDCAGLHILPGVIDTQVHFREPGGEHKETLETGMKAAALGGVTAIFEMPNTNPLTTTPDALEDKLERASKAAWTDYAFYFGGTQENSKSLSEWENLKGACGVKIFVGSSTGNLLTATDEAINAVMANGKRLVAVHAEDEFIMQENQEKILGDSNDVAMHHVWRSEEGCINATKRVLDAARKHGRRVHILHVTTAQEMEILAENKDIATVEVLANHLTLHAPDCYEELGTHAQQNPPIREKHHQDALWAAINDGTVDILASDHAPHTLEEKAQIYPKSPSGTPGVQTLVPIMLNHVNNGKLTLEKLVELLCHGPCRVHQIARKGRIAKGYDGDFTIVDMNKTETITNEQQASHAGWTPFNGVTVRGWPVATIIRGNIVMRDGELKTPIGQAVEFKETL